MTADETRDGPVLLFDGVCNLCSGIVQFVVERDPEGRFRFAPLQSETARELLADVGYGEYDLDSFVYVDGEDFYTKSDAALRVVRDLDSPWSALWTARFVPRVIRDAVYDLIAKYRYAVFGKKDRCMVPTPEIRDRFLELSHPESAESGATAMPGETAVTGKTGETGETGETGQTEETTENVRTD